MIVSRSGQKKSNYDGLGCRLLFLFFALMVFRLGTHVPIPGINPETLEHLFQNNQGGILGLFNMFSGGALSRLSIFSLGIMPYISSSIMMQLFSAIVPSLDSLKREGESGRRKINQYTRYATLALALAQSIGVSLVLEYQEKLVINPGFSFLFTTIITLITGSIFLMWLGEQITERGLGNGISILIFSGIVAGFPSSLALLLEMIRNDSIETFSGIFILILSAVITAFVVLVERGQRKISVNYAKRQIGNKLYAAQSSHLPLKLNMSGVIPPIFASSLILFPSTLANWFANSGKISATWLRDLSVSLAPNQPLYIVIYSAAIIFFCFFYTTIIFNSRETADNLKRSGAFLQGIRPGEQTARYIEKILMRLTLSGSIYITLVCLIPEFLIMRWNVPFNFGGTSLLIIVVVTMDFISQVQTYIMSNQYDSLLKKANFKIPNLPTR